MAELLWRRGFSWGNGVKEFVRWGWVMSEVDGRGRGKLMRVGIKFGGYFE